KDLLSQGINLNVYPQHPAGARVELYGYSSLLSPDSPMMVGETSLAGSIGDFAVARGYLQNNAQRMSVSPPQGGAPFPVGEGFEPNWTGDLDLADPIQTSDKDPAAAQANILNAFPETGGYAILCQLQVGFQNSLQIGGQTNTMNTGGMEIVRYDSRQGSKLKNVQRAQQIPGDDRTTPTLDYDGAARRFITKWDRGLYWDPVAQIYFHDVTRAILWVIPISLPVQSTSVLWDPQSTQLSEWVQIYPRGGNDFDTEWVRYDAIMGNQHLTRGNRVAWERTRWQVCRSIGIYTINIFQGQQSNGIPNDDGSDPWGTVQATSGYIGYTPQLEATFPAIHAARSQLGFRGDMMNDFYQEGLNRTSAHPHGAGDVVMQCQRVDLRWGNFGAYTGRPGRHDRVALIQGSVASGSQRPTVEWHTVHWAARRFDSDNLSKNATPPERLGPWPFQLVAFKDGVRTPFQGPPSNQQNYQDPRSYDRMVKFPSGELPAAYCQQVSVGAGIGNDSPIQGFIDEVEVTTHSLPPLVVDDAFDSSAKTFQVDISKSYDPTGLISFVADYSADWPQKGGGLVQVDGEILAFSDLTLGRFTIATNGRGLLGTEPRDHDRGAHVVLLTHRPAAILTSQVSARDNLLPVQALGGLPRGGGTLRLGTELLHYTWSRQLGDAGQLEMPRWYPPGEAGTSSLARGLLRARYGTQASVASSGEAVIVWPFRYWDRYAEQSDDPELGYSQLTTTSAPAYFRSVTWSEQIRDGSVDVICRVRADGRAPWSADPETTPGLWEFTRGANDPAPSLLATQASRLEIRFQTVYKGGAVDLVTQRAHGWKTSARVTDVHVDYEGEPRIFNERVTAQ
ncbi:MAG: hypothetical protein KDE27_03075, partial [Planctomycetes bacterium]|nr:hypothetical protein [Planctomycetota bacterium]